MVGVRPNSPIAITSVDSSRPRSSRSSTSAVSVRSSGGVRRSRWPLSLSLCVSQEVRVVARRGDETAAGFD